VELTACGRSDTLGKPLSTGANAESWIARPFATEQCLFPKEKDHCEGSKKGHAQNINWISKILIVQLDRPKQGKAFVRFSIIWLACYIDSLAELW